MGKITLLNELRDEILRNELPLKKEARNLVFGGGNPDAEVVFVGEAPGRNEDIQGRPFVGRAGNLLTELLTHIGLRRQDVYITNIVKYRPPNNRNPTTSEIRAHSPFLVKQLKIINPKIVVTLGNFSTKFLLANFSVDRMKNISGISEIHGMMKKIDAIDSLIMPTYHPAAALYNPGLRPILKIDFENIKKELNSA